MHYFIIFLGHKSCEHCGKSFQRIRAGRFEKHIKKHLITKAIIEQDFKCDFCNRDYRNKHKLKQHKTKYCPENRGTSTKVLGFNDPFYDMPFQGQLAQYKCDFPGCGKIYTNKNKKRDYEKHRRKHLVIKATIEQESKCDFCNKDYGNKCKLKQHKTKYCPENRSTSTKVLDFNDPSYVMPKPKIELDWSWRDKIKKEKEEKALVLNETKLSSKNQNILVKVSDFSDPLYVMPKPEIELDWSWRDEMKKEKSEKSLL